MILKICIFLLNFNLRLCFIYLLVPNKSGLEDCFLQYVPNSSLPFPDYIQFLTSWPLLLCWLDIEITKEEKLECWACLVGNSLVWSLPTPNTKSQVLGSPRELPATGDWDGWYRKQDMSLLGSWLKQWAWYYAIPLPKQGEKTIL